MTEAFSCCVLGSRWFVFNYWRMLSYVLYFQANGKGKCKLI